MSSRSNKIFSKIGLLVFLFGITNTPLIAQQQLHLNLQVADIAQEQLEKKLEYEKVFNDSLSLVDQLKSVVLQLHAQAHLEASIDSLSQKDSLVTAHLFVGKTYEWAALQNGNVEEAFLSQVGFRERLYRKKAFHYKEVLELQESLLTYAENNGYPFATVWLDSVQINQGRIAAQLMMEKGRLVLMDGINVIGDANISDTYLENYLGLKKGNLYSKEKVKKVRARIKELPFVQEKENTTVTFKGNKAVTNLFLVRKKASRFDILVGLLPNSEVEVPGGPTVRQFLLTGTIDVDMHNQFGLGEKVMVEFQQLRPETQELRVNFEYPYILNFPFGIDVDFELFKRDTTSLDVTYDFGVQYLFEGGNYVKAFWNNTVSNILTINTTDIRNRQRLPASLDYSNASFGLEYYLQKLDYRLNPRKGWGVKLRGDAGVKKIRKNNSILDIEDPAVDYTLAYDTLDLKTFQYRIAAELEYYLPMFSRGALKLGLNSGWYISQNPIYQNEQYRIGGNRLLRGFDEKTVFATRYAVGTLEYRLLVSQNSYLYAFADYGYVENVTTTQNDIDQPLGFGAGLTFETKVGLFGFSLALGRQQNNPIDFRNVKTHFGYVSLF